MKVIQVETFGVQMGEAMKSGFTFTCAMCFKLHLGKQKTQGTDWNKVSCMATLTGQPCGGPGVGMNYPQYEGPLDQNLVSHCVFCGKKDPEHAVTVKADPNRLLGVCKDHMKRLKTNWSASPNDMKVQPVIGPLDIKG